jgi:putative zinc finger protein
MDHGYFRDRLSAYIDQELTPEETRALAEHLEECAECREELAKLKEIERLVEEHSGLDGDDYFERAAQKIEQRLGATATTVTDISGASAPRFKGLWWKVTSVAASAAVLVFIGLHRDDIFTTNDLTLPAQAPSEKQLQMAPVVPPVGSDTAALFRDMDEEEAISTAAAEREMDATDQVPEPANEQVMDEATSPGGDIGFLKTVTEEKTADKKDETQSISIPKPVSIDRFPEGADVRSESESAEWTPPPAPPSRPPGRISRGSATSTVQEDTRPVTRINDNYARPMLDQAVDQSLDQTIEVKGVPEDVIEAFAEDGDFVPDRGLTYWVQRRDSLTNLAVSDSPAEEVNRAFRAGGTNSLTQTAPSAEPPARAKKADKVEADLLEAWFWIGRLSEDNSETSSARAELERVAADSTSVNRDLAAEYLRRLSNK